MARHVTVGEYALGVDGLALLRLHRALDAAPADEVAAEMRALLDRLEDPDLHRDSRRDPVEVVEGYGRWAAVYDRPGNPVVANEQPAVWDLLDASPGEPVLDAACGTGRHLVYLSEGGRAVIGVDLSEAMLAEASRKLPEADLRRGDLRRLELEDQVVAGAVCALSLEHVADLHDAYGELARVVKSGGWVITSTVHPAIALIGWHAWFVDDKGRTDVRTYNHSFSDHLHAARAAGLQLVDCREPRLAVPIAGPDHRPRPQLTGPEAPLVPAGGPAAMDGFPVVLVLKFERS